jgi:subtilase family serine protease
MPRVRFLHPRSHARSWTHNAGSGHWGPGDHDRRLAVRLAQPRAFRPTPKPAAASVAIKQLSYSYFVPFDLRLSPAPSPLHPGSDHRPPAIYVNSCHPLLTLHNPKSNIWAFRVAGSFPASDSGVFADQEAVCGKSGLWLQAWGVSMKIRPSVVLLCTLLSLAASTRAQQIAPRPLITQAVDEGSLVTLKGNTHPLARPQFDVGVAAPDEPMRRMLLVLKRSPEQEFALRKLLDDQQDKASPNYHKWLTPDEFGQQFGPADQDLQIVTGWLRSHGLQVNRVTHGRTIIEFTGVESQVEEALHTQIHKYLVNGEEHWANASDPQIPAALAPVVAGVKALNNFPATPHSRLGGVVTREKSTGRITSAKPLFTLGGQCGVPNGCFGVGPYDFATIYDVLAAWTATPAIDGTGETIAIVGETDINPQDIADFRNFFGLPAYGQQGGPKLNVIHDGPAPGILSDGEESESDLDVEWSGAVAKGANIDFVVAETTETTFGIDLSALHIVDNNLAAVMSESYGQCELFIGSGGNQFFSALWQQAAAQGMTVLLSSGDGSSAGCDDFNAGGPATLGLAVSGYASTPYNVAVGGTDFNDLTNASTYWSNTNDATTHASALSYIPETTWDDTCTNPVFGTLLGFSKNAETNCNNAQIINAGFVNIVGGSGGKSSCVNSDGQNPGSCTGGYPKPSWQNAPGVPADGVRDVPDVSLFAAIGGPSGAFYLICESDLVNFGTSCDPNDPSTQFVPIGGTSASSPAFAGVMALVNQQTGERQGNANFVLYKLAQQHPTTFHDVTTGTIAVPCRTGSSNCTTSRVGDQFGILNGYNTGAGYDLGTGIGSVDVNNLLQNWTLAKFTATTTNLSLSPTTNLTHGQAVTVTGGVASTSGSGDPTGAVSLVTSTGLNVGGFQLNNGVISGSTNLLPGGSYTVTAQYFGDSNFGGSQSAPVNVTVTKENSSSQLQLVTFDFGGNLLSNNATTAVYGSPYLLRVNVLNSQGVACQPNPFGEAACPTGNVTLTDNSSALDGGSFALNSLGYTEDQLVQFLGGSNDVKAQYAGDNSFNASSTTTTYKITPAPTTISAPSINVVAAGLPATISSTVQASPTTGVSPSGSITFSVNGSPFSGSTVLSPVQGGTFSDGFTALSTATLNSSTSPFPTPGTYTVLATYSGDGNYSGSTSSATTLSLKYPTPTVLVNASSYNLQPGANLTLTAFVIGVNSTVNPTGTIAFVSNVLGPIPGTVSYMPTTFNGMAALQASIVLVPVGSDNYGARYSGDANYPAGNGDTGIVAVNGSDFSLGVSATTVTVQQGGFGTLNLLVGMQSNAANVTFSAAPCSGLPSEATCSASPSSLSFSSTTLLTITAATPHSAAAVRKEDAGRGLLLAIGAPFAAIFIIGIPCRPVRRKLASALAVGFLLVIFACGGGSSSSPPPPLDPGTPKGSYPITITATSGSGTAAITHTTTFTLVVH